MTQATMQRPDLFETPDLANSILNRHARIAVMGLGYVGLPMALSFARAGFSVVGVDVDQDRCASLTTGHSYIEDLSDDQLKEAVQDGRLRASTNPDVLADADVIIICVPTPLRKSKDPDMRAILSAGDAIASRIKPGQLIILESTTYPGTTEEVLLPMFTSRGLTVGEEFFLAFSPERVDPGNSVYGVANITKLVGGVTRRCTELASQLYQQIVDEVVSVSSTRVAEAAKLLENTFRSVNIGLVNEMVVICKHLGIDVWEVIDAAATKPFGFMAHYPGPGIGGHCIPLDPHYLSWKTRLMGYEPRFISLASEINSSMPKYVISLISEALNDNSQSLRGSNVLLLGMAYKPNVGDYRESPALEVMHLLEEKGAKVTYCDPYVPTIPVDDRLLMSQPLTRELLLKSDCVVVLTNHKDFNYEMIVNESKLVIDTRNATRKYAQEGNVKFL